MFQSLKFNVNHNRHMNYYNQKTLVNWGQMKWNIQVVIWFIELVFHEKMDACTRQDSFTTGQLNWNLMHCTQSLSLVCVFVCVCQTVCVCESVCVCVSDCVWVETSKTSWPCVLQEAGILFPLVTIFRFFFGGGATKQERKSVIKLIFLNLFFSRKFDRRENDLDTRRPRFCVFTFTFIVRRHLFGEKKE